MDKEYWIYWVDRYSGGAIVGAFHALDDDTFKTLCGLDFNDRMDIDGGYNSTDEQQPNCKKCLKKLTAEHSA